jgi:hypothetical protein
MELPHNPFKPYALNYDDAGQYNRRDWRGAPNRGLRLSDFPSHPDLAERTFHQLADASGYLAHGEGGFGRHRQIRPGEGYNVTLDDKGVRLLRCVEPVRRNNSQT